MKRAIVAILIAALVGLLAWQIVVRVGDSAEGIVKKVGGPGGGATPVAVVDIARATVRDLQLFTGTLVPRRPGRPGGRCPPLAPHAGHNPPESRLGLRLQPCGRPGSRFGIAAPGNRRSRHGSFKHYGSRKFVAAAEDESAEVAQAPAMPATILRLQIQLITAAGRLNRRLPIALLALPATQFNIRSRSQTV